LLETVRISKRRADPVLFDLILFAQVVMMPYNFIWFIVTLLSLFLHAWVRFVQFTPACCATKSCEGNRALALCNIRSHHAVHCHCAMCTFCLLTCLFASRECWRQALKVRPWADIQTSAEPRCPARARLQDYVSIVNNSYLMN
jgi:hypothetical protein